MNEQVVLSVGSEALKTMIFIASPLLIVSMIVGIVISVLQAITQINEATLTFIPKMIAIVVVLAVMAPWMLKVLEEYAITVFGNVGEWIR